MASGNGTVLVTGGSGFVGSHLVDRLIGKGHRVVAVDDLSSGKKANLHPRAELQQMDIRDPRVKELVAEVKPGAA